MKKLLSLIICGLFLPGCTPTTDYSKQPTATTSPTLTKKRANPGASVTATAYARDHPVTSPPVESPTEPSPKPTEHPVAKRFSEDERREIFRQIGEAEAKGDREAEAMYPTDPNNPAVTADMARDNVKPYAELSNKLEEKYRNKVLRKFRLSEKEWGLITIEGINKRWPPLDQGYQPQ